MKKIIKSKEYDEILDSIQAKEWDQQKAEDILAYATTICKIAYEKGLARGLKEAQEDALEQSVSLVSDSIDYIQQLENDVVNVILTNIRKIVADYEPDELLTKSIKQSLTELYNARKITLRISPSVSHQTLIKIRSLEISTSSLNVVTDHRVEQDDCIIESDLGVVHVNVEQKIDQLEKIFRSSIGFNSSDHLNPNSGEAS